MFSFEFLLYVTDGIYKKRKKKDIKLKQLQQSKD